MFYNNRSLAIVRSFKNQEKEMPNILPSFLRSLVASSAMTVVFMSAACANTATPAFGTSNLYDNFEGNMYNLSDGQTSPNGKWFQAWTGHGKAGVVTILSTGNEVFFAKPKASTSPQETHSSLTLTTKNWQNAEIHVKVRTKQQLRQNSAPNTWEAAWVMWRYVDSYHHYYFILKPNGIELGKKDNDRQAEEQVFLYTTGSPKLQLDKWSNWTIKMQGNHIQVYVNSLKVADYIDNTMSHTLSNPGAVGLYTEDAHVQFDDVYISPLS
jgi:hypothetical protein